MTQPMPPSGSLARLPEPDAVALAHSDRLLSLLRKRLRSGPISFADYMQCVLYEPGLGYYMAGARKFGRGGDFTTAPEVSDLFGACIARQCQQVLGECGGDILELGAGSGRLCASVLANLADDAPGQYLILEPSAELQQRQRAYLSGKLDESLSGRVRWLERLPDSFTGVCLANEVMDALPVEQFSRDDAGILHIGVGLENPAATDAVLEYTSRPASEDVFATSAAVADAVAHIEHDIGFTLPRGYRSEVCLLLAPWIQGLCACIERGVVLLADYGYPRGDYYTPERRSGTFTCFYQHRAHYDAFFNPGLQDLTAHVDFTRVVEAGVDAGFELLGYSSQSGFLLGCGIASLAEARHASCSSQTEQLHLAQQVKTLTLPGEMGERFQFMALGKNIDSALAGFTGQDLSHRL